MVTISVEIPDGVADALASQARALLLGRRAYVRAVLAAVAEQSQRDTLREPRAGVDPHPGTSGVGQD